jgi:hypothetical protein
MTKITSPLSYHWASNPEVAGSNAANAEFFNLVFGFTLRMFHQVQLWLGNEKTLNYWVENVKERSDAYLGVSCTGKTAAADFLQMQEGLQRQLWL